MNDETRKKLEETGVPVGGWSESEGGERPLPPLLAKYKGALMHVKKLLEVQLEKDRAILGKLYEQLSRAKHGGGG
jgi:hypothetical protein